MQKPVSVQLFSVRESMANDFPGTLEKISAMGYAGVEFSGLYNRPSKEVAQILKDLGIAASSAYVELPTKENIQRLADDARTLGYDILVSGFGPNVMKTEDDIKVCIEKFTGACETVKPHGLHFAMHNHWWEFDRQFGGKTLYEIILQTVPELMSELDIYWATKGGADTAEVTRTWKKRIPLLHVKDGDLGEKHVHKAVGEGKVPIKTIIEQADPMVLQWLVVELDACETDMFDALKKSHQWLLDNGVGDQKG